ncbi:TetR/AcrR family transcriptional regulator [Alphaproteobacteria bacterium]|nr:TetR/AcrR family transcriptional regulator [Alphaproteobacteria bacterium]
MTTVKVKEKIILSALELAAEQGWGDVTLADIAAKANVGVAELYDIFEDKGDILSGLGRMIDKKILSDVRGAANDESPRDLLFDLLMDRFESLNKHRDGVIAILASIKFDPKQAVIALPHLCRSMSWMLEACGISTYGIKGALRVSGLTALYLKAARVWMSDESADLAKVMASLDKDLGRIESWAGTLGL